MKIEKLYKKSKNILAHIKNFLHMFTLLENTPFEEHKIWCPPHLVVKMWRLLRLILLLRNLACELGARSFRVNYIDHLKLYEWQPVCFKNSSFAITTVSTSKHILSSETLPTKTSDNQTTQNYYHFYLASKYFFKQKVNTP